MAMSIVLCPHFHVRHELVPVGTVSLTTYFPTNADDLAGEDITACLR